MDAGEFKCLDVYDFRTLDAARKIRGHSIEAACATIGVSRPTWYAWGKGACPRWLQRQAALKYIAETPEK